MNRPDVLVTRPIMDGPVARLRERCDVTVHENEFGIAREELIEVVRGRDALITMLTKRVDAELLAAAGPRLKIVVNHAVGFDNVNLADCTAAGVLATNTPDVLTETTADTAFALLMAAARRVGEGERLIRSGRPLDVFENEPDVHPKLLALENVVVIPHLGSATVDTRGAMGHLVVDNVFAALDGTKPPTLLNPEAFTG